MNRVHLLAPAVLALNLTACDLLGLTGPDGPPPIPVCEGQVADTSGHRAASAALQACIAATASGGVLELPPGVYRIDRQLVIDHPMTLRAAGAAGRVAPCWPDHAGCVVLRADPELFPRGGTLDLYQAHPLHNGVLDVARTRDVRIEYVVLDGNRQRRLRSEAARRCSDGVNRYGFNAAVRASASVHFLHSASVRALCGTGIEWWGDSAVVENSVFQDNGDGSGGMWSDGLTLLQSNGALVTGSHFVDNTDVALILGGGTGSVVRGNTVIQSRVRAFGGITLYNFNDVTSADFTDTVVEDNSVNCSDGKCNYGIVVGSHTWQPMNPTRGGTVRRNTVSGAWVAMIVEGAGTVAKPVHVYDNVLGALPPSRIRCLQSGERLTTSTFNIGDDAVVDRHGDATPATRVTWHLCPRFAVLGAVGAPDAPADGDVPD